MMKKSLVALAVAAALSPTVGLAAPSTVQVSASTTSSSANTTHTPTLPAPTTEGNPVFAFGRCLSSTSDRVTSISDPVDGTTGWVEIADTGTGSPGSHYLFAAYKLDAPSIDEVTITTNGSLQCTFALAEMAPSAGTEWNLVMAGTPQLLSSADPLTATDLLTPTAANQVALSFIAAHSSSQSFSPNNGETEIAEYGTRQQAQYRLSSGAGNYSPSWDISFGSAAIATGVVFEEVATDPCLGPLSAYDTCQLIDTIAVGSYLAQYNTLNDPDYAAGDYWAANNPTPGPHIMKLYDNGNFCYSWNVSLGICNDADEAEYLFLWHGWDTSEGALHASGETQEIVNPIYPTCFFPVTPVVLAYKIGPLEFPSFARTGEDDETGCFHAGGRTLSYNLLSTPDTPPLGFSVGAATGIPEEDGTSAENESGVSFKLEVTAATTLLTTEVDLVAYPLNTVTTPACDDGMTTGAQCEASATAVWMAYAAALACSPTIAAGIVIEQTPTALSEAEPAVFGSTPDTLQATVSTGLCGVGPDGGGPDGNGPDGDGPDSDGPG